MIFEILLIQFFSFVIARETDPENSGGDRGNLQRLS